MPSWSDLSLAGDRLLRILPEALTRPLERAIGEVDAVVAWVDGDDPVHLAKRKRFLKGMPEEGRPSRNARKARRFRDNDEIRYCIRSLRNHAPWLRTIWLVTDEQFPACFDRAEAERAGLRVVDHRHIFRGFEDLLPTFNSQAIESMLWRIDGLADRFLYLNDDMFLAHPIRPMDFFRPGKAVLRGRWQDLTGAGASPHARRRVRAGEMLGFPASRSFVPNHVVYPMLRPAMETLFERFRSEFLRNASYRFRDEAQFWAISLHNHYLLATGQAVVRKPVDTVHFSVRFCSNADAGELRERLARLHRPRILAGCVNYAEEVAEKVPELFGLLDRATGPALPFERRKPLPHPEGTSNGP